MCIICVSPKGRNLPPKKTIEYMFKGNADGAGIAYYKNGKVHIDKGYFKVEDLLERLNKLKSEINIKESTIMLHFRISTSGLINANNCHPYPLNTFDKKIGSKKCVCKSAIAHNGVIRDFSIYNSEMNDTQLFIIEILNSLPKNWYKDKTLRYLVRNSIDGSRLAIIDENNEHHLIGKWESYKGLYYSNSNYKSHLSMREYYSYLNKLREKEDENQLSLL